MIGSFYKKVCIIFSTFLRKEPIVTSGSITVNVTLLSLQFFIILSRRFRFYHDKSGAFAKWLMTRHVLNITNKRTINWRWFETAYFTYHTHYRIIACSSFGITGTQREREKCFILSSIKLQWKRVNLLSIFNTEKRNKNMPWKIEALVCAPKIIY